MVTWHQIITVILSIVVAMSLYVLLSRTRIGTAMRASVDNPELLQLYGGRPQVVAALAWAIGSSLAALAGILLAPVIGLQYYDLTLLVISAYAAAMLGKLTNLPMTYVGAMALGIGQSYVVGYLAEHPVQRQGPGSAGCHPDAVPVRDPGAAAAGAAADRPGQGHRLRAGADAGPGRGLGSGARRRRHRPRRSACPTPTCCWSALRPPTRS